MTNLEVKEDGLIYVDGILVSDQEKAKRIIWKEKTGISEHISDIHINPGIYPIPDLQWEVKESWGPYHENTFPEKVAILKESTPYNQNLKEVSKGELLNIIKEKCDQLEQEDKSRRLAANPEAVFVRAEVSTPSTEQESQEELWMEAINETVRLDSRISRIEWLKERFTITRKP